MKARFSKFISVSPKLLGKLVWEDHDGNRAGETVMTYSRGKFEVMSVATLAEFADVIASLQPGKEHLFYSIRKDGAESGILTSGAGPTGKTKDNLIRPKGQPGIITCDIDPPPGREGEFTADRADACLLAACPDLITAGTVWVPSASSFIYREDEQVTGLRGARIYFGIQDASHTEEVLDILHKRMWLAGEGWITIGSAGQLLERSPVDKAMRPVTQPDFAAGAYCEPPYSQRRGEPVVTEGEDWVDSRCLIPPLTPAEEAEYARLVAEAKAERYDEAAPLREAALQARGQCVARSRTGSDDPAVIAAEIARLKEEGVLREVDKPGEPLPLGWPIHLRDGRVVSVEDILMEPDRFQHEICHDPLQDQYVAGKIFTDGFPNIHSCASGGVTYPLGTPEEQDEIRSRRQAVFEAMLQMRALPPRLRDEINKTLGGDSGPVSD